MPLKKSERQTPKYQLLSSQKAQPRAVMTGRFFEHRDNGTSHVPVSYQALPDWSRPRTGGGAPRIGSRSVGPGNRMKAVRDLDPDTMLGHHLRSTATCGIGQYDPVPGLGETTHKKGAVMVGCHSKPPVEGSAADTSHQPSPIVYASEYGTLGYAATMKRAESARAIGGCTFGRRIDENPDNGAPGPGQYDEFFPTAISPLGPDDSERNRSSPGRRKLRGSRPSTVESSFTSTSRGVSMKGRNWRDHSELKSERENTKSRNDGGPGPAAYSLPSILPSRVPSMKFRAAHPFVDHLAAHDCAKRSDGAHKETRRFRATPRL